MAYQLRNIKVLVVENSRAMFELTKGVLEAFGVGQVISAYDCEQGFDRFCKHNPDIVILDWLGEKQNGLELTRRIRKEKDSPNPFVPIIMTTGFSQLKRVIMARDSGVTEFLVKPFTSNMLAHRVELLIEKPRIFVKSSHYVGPDRRRRKIEGYQGPRRREEEEVAPETASTKTPAEAARRIRDNADTQQTDSRGKK